MRTVILMTLFSFLISCGKKSGKLDQSITKGQVTKGQEIPFSKYPSVRPIKFKGITHCTGTFITPNLMLTAAHCVALGARLNIIEKIEKLNNYQVKIEIKKRFTKSFPPFLRDTKEMDEVLSPGGLIVVRDKSKEKFRAVISESFPDGKQLILEMNPEDMETLLSLKKPNFFSNYVPQGTAVQVSDSWFFQNETTPSKVLIHPEYQMKGKRQHSLMDIAILVFDTKVSAHTTPVAQKPIEDQQSVILVGYGRTSDVNTHTKGTKREGQNIFFKALQDKFDLFDKIHGKKNLYFLEGAYDSNSSTPFSSIGKGDSGGPLFVYGKNQIHGVVSKGVLAFDSSQECLRSVEKAMIEYKDKYALIKGPEYLKKEIKVHSSCRLVSMFVKLNNPELLEYLQIIINQYSL